MSHASGQLDLSGLEIRPIRSKASVKNFDCGEYHINSWIRDKAFKYHDSDRNRVFCAFTRGSETPSGLFALSFSPIASNMLFGQDADKYKDGSAPFVYLDWLAVQKQVQSNGLGTIMLLNALEKAADIDKNVSIYGVALRSLNERTTAYYKRLNFVERESGRNPLMILPMQAVRDLFRP